MFYVKCILSEMDYVIDKQTIKPFYYKKRLIF
jgi:hypothetical protein